VGHRQLLVRSNKDGETATRITVQFLFVSEIHLPTTFCASEIVDVSSSLLRESPDAFSEAGLLRFEIRNPECVGYVCASRFVVHEDALEYNAPTPADIPRRPSGVAEI